LHLTTKYDGLRTKILQLNQKPPNLPFLNNKEILTSTKNTHLHPAKKNFKYESKQPPYSNNMNIFTDGSKSEAGVGAAFVAFKGTELFTSKNVKLNPEASVFQAELFALQTALAWIEENTTSIRNIKIQIFSDSQSSLKAICKFHQQNPQVQVIQKIIVSLQRNHQIKFYWIKAHTGIFGNEEADRQAKIATNKPSIDTFLPLTPTHIKNTLKQLKLKDWSDLWEDPLQAGRITQKYIPKISDTALFDSPALNSLLTNHGPFVQYLNRFHIPEYNTPNCVCGEVGDAEHYLFSCPLSSELHFIKPINSHWYEWSKQLNSNKLLRAKAVKLFTWVVDNGLNLLQPS
jgi:ribonuclease HI